MESLRDFLTRYWREVLIGLLLLIVSISWYFDRASLVTALDAATSRYEQEVRLIKESHARELEKKAELLTEYEEKIKTLQVIYNENQKEIEQLKADSVTKITRLRQTDPDAVAKKIEQAFGFEYVE
mgnify:FL=1